METNKKILDACCGPKMFWKDKHQPNTIFIDIRKMEKGYNDYRKNREIQPDIIMDFRKLEFPDKSFKLVCFDPPHIISASNNFRMARDYGILNKETWKEDLKKGFSTKASLSYALLSTRKDRTSCLTPKLPWALTSAT